MYTKHLTLANNVQIPQLGPGIWFIEDAAVYPICFTVRFDRTSKDRKSGSYAE